MKTKVFLCLLLLISLLCSLSSCLDSTESVDKKTEVTTDSENSMSNDKNDSKDEKVDYSITNTVFTTKESLGTNTYCGIIEITNNCNSNLYLESAVFDLEDNDGHLLQSDDFVSSCPNVIAPGEIGYFYSTGIIDNSTDTSNGLKLVPKVSVEKATESFTNLEVSDTDIHEDDIGWASVTGRVSNTTEEEISYLDVKVIFYDKDGNVIGIDSTSVTDLKPGTASSFECSGITLSGENSFSDIADYKVVAQTTYFQW